MYTKSVKRFERSDGLDTALYKNYLYLFMFRNEWLKDDEFNFKPWPRTMPLGTWYRVAW